MIQNLFFNTLFSSLSDWEKSARIFGIKLIDFSDFSELLLRFGFNTIILLLILQFVYMRNSKRKDFFFSYMAVGTIVFMLCFLLNSLDIELGFALGLFAIFGIIRYRTDAIPIKEMTYLFVIIGVSIMNALGSKKISYAEVMFSNLVVLFGLWMLERYLKLKQEGSLRITYENISNIHIDNHEALMQDLIKRTGVDIMRFEIEKIDYLRDIAIITIYFHAGENGFSQKVLSQTEEQNEAI